MFVTYITGQSFVIINDLAKSWRPNNWVLVLSLDHEPESLCVHMLLLGTAQLEELLKM